MDFASLLRVTDRILRLSLFICSCRHIEREYVKPEFANIRKLGGDMVCVIDYFKV